MTAAPAASQLCSLHDTLRRRPVLYNFLSWLVTFVERRTGLHLSMTNKKVSRTDTNCSLALGPGHAGQGLFSGDRGMVFNRSILDTLLQDTDHP